MKKYTKKCSQYSCFVFLFFLLIISGCATSKQQYGGVKISSAPDGAEVVNLKDDTSLGVTPVEVSFSGDEGTAELVTVQLRKKGYYDRITSFWINRRHNTPDVALENAIDIHVDLDKNTTD